MPRSHPRRRRTLVVTGIALAFAAAFSGPAAADSTLVGPLPAGPTTTVNAKRGTLVAVVLRSRKPSTGLVWRLARPYDSKVVQQVSEGEIGDTVVIVYRVVGTGRATLAYALTRGESSPTAVAAHTYRVRAT